HIKTGFGTGRISKAGFDAEMKIALDYKLTSGAITFEQFADTSVAGVCEERTARRPGHRRGPGRARRRPPARGAAPRLRHRRGESPGRAFVALPLGLARALYAAQRRRPPRTSFPGGWADVSRETGGRLLPRA